MPDTTPPTVPTSSEERARPRVLIADDDPEMRDSLGEFLRFEGYDVELAETGRTALEVLADRTRRPAVMILDLNMPGLSGWDVLDAVVTRPGYTGTSVIVLSGARDVASPLPRIRWMRKPVEPVDLLTAVRAALAAAKPTIS
jgi:CheY-like chemotaxis protein